MEVGVRGGTHAYPIRIVMVYRAGISFAVYYWRQQMSKPNLALRMLLAGRPRCCSVPATIHPACMHAVSVWATHQREGPERLL
jgi:hypothetical protein